jgi:ATPase subunit of ABC transporter with duplicated ATPase domains
MLSLERVSKFHGASPILVEVSVGVPPGARIGVVGPNGIGKSTLLRLLAGLEEPDAGRVVRTPRTLTVGYVPQERDARPGETLTDYFGRRTGAAEAETELHAAAEALTAGRGGDRYDEALGSFLALGGPDLHARAREACVEVGLPPDRLELSMTALSGGEAARAALAAILLARFDVLLLDEPTNDLDFEGLDRLERFVASTPASVVVVSHDRTFLDRVVERVVELEEGSHRAREYPGGWSEYEAERDRARARHYERWEQSIEEHRRIDEQARRMQQWEERGYGQGRKKKKSKDVKKAFAKKVERVESVDKPWEPWDLRLSLAPQSRSGDVVVRLDRAVLERGSFRLGPIDLEVRWGDRLAVLGPNGSGKTTLLSAVAGTLPLEAGTRYAGTGVVFGELDQERARFAGDGVLLDAFGSSTSDARSLLAKFGLGADDVLRPGSSLSPGERTRAQVALLAARGVNCLVLDEPTNHLDVPAIEELETALDSYKGTVVIVTHDRRFLDRFAATRTLRL